MWKMNVRNRDPAEQNSTFFRQGINPRAKIFFAFKRNNRIAVQRPFSIKMLGMFIPTVHGLEMFFYLK